MLPIYLQAVFLCDDIEGNFCHNYGVMSKYIDNNSIDDKVIS
jgi:hypothetical protein